MYLRPITPDMTFLAREEKPRNYRKVKQLVAWIVFVSLGAVVSTLFWYSVGAMYVKP